MRIKKLIGGVLLAALLIAGYVVALMSFRADSEARSSAYSISTSNGNPDSVAVSATLLSLDPVRNEANVRLAFTPQGALATPSGALAQDLVFTVDSSTGNAERPFPKGKLMNPTDVVIGLSGGQISDYPFDSYQTALAFFFTTTAPADKPVESVPVDLQLTAGLHGYQIDVSADPHNSSELVEADMSIGRARSTLFFAIFVMTLMWLLALGALCLAWRVVVLGLKSEVPMFTFLTAMLFAFPTVRNALPGAPPIGSLNDFLSFFWTEGIVAVSLVCIVIPWLFRAIPRPAS